MTGGGRLTGRLGTYAENRDNINAYFEDFKKTATLEPWQRPVAPITTGMTSNLVLVSAMLPSLERVQASLDGIHKFRRAYLVMSALERCRAKSGEYPAALEQLVPEFLPALPMDPLSGKPFLYERIDPATDKHQRSYLLRLIDKTILNDPDLRR